LICCAAERYVNALLVSQDLALWPEGSAQGETKMQSESIRRLWRVLALLLSLTLLAASCGSDGDSAAESEVTEAAESSDTTEDAGGDDDAAEPVAAAGGSIDYLGWEGYDTFFGANADSLAELGIDFNATYMGAPSDIAAAFASGGGEGIDLLAWTSANHRQYRGIEGTLSPITVEEVPNLAGLIDRFGADEWGQFTDDNGDWLAIPFSFAPIGITYDSSRVSPTSYADLRDPSFAGRLGVSVPSPRIRTS